jgi:hypothetical protein
MRQMCEEQTLAELLIGGVPPDRDGDTAGDEVMACSMAFPVWFVPIWEPAQTANPLRQWQSAVPY